MRGIGTPCFSCVIPTYRVLSHSVIQYVHMYVTHMNNIRTLLLYVCTYMHNMYSVGFGCTIYGLEYSIHMCIQLEGCQYLLAPSCVCVKIPILEWLYPILVAPTFPCKVVNHS